MMDGIISIIIPVYNVEKYLDRCMRSILKQTYSKLEIILVDDGSTDNCGKLCDLYVQRDNRIKVLHKKNEGLGYARNSGLDIATGQYVMFVDSDDYIELEACEKLVLAINDFKADICFFRNYFERNGEKVGQPVSGLKKVYEGKQIIFDFLTNTIAREDRGKNIQAFEMSACCVLYKRNIIEENKIRFCSEREYLSEDLLFRIDLCKKVQKVVVLEENLYIYCYNGESLTKSYRRDRFDAALRLYEKILSECKDIDEGGKLENKCFRQLLYYTTFCVMQEVNYADENGGKSAWNNIKQICSNQKLQKVIKIYPKSKLALKNRFFFCAVRHKWTAVVFCLTKIKLWSDKQVYKKTGKIYEGA